MVTFFWVCHDKQSLSGYALGFVPYIKILISTALIRRKRTLLMCLGSRVSFQWETVIMRMSVTLLFCNDLTRAGKFQCLCFTTSFGIWQLRCLQWRKLCNGNNIWAKWKQAFSWTHHDVYMQTLSKHSRPFQRFSSLWICQICYSFNGLCLAPPSCPAEKHKHKEENDTKESQCRADKDSLPFVYIFLPPYRG